VESNCLKMMPSQVHCEHVASKVSITGVVMSTYVPAGDIPLGSFSQAEPSAKELTRRAKMAKDAS
jgi:hypothetical protein